MVGFWDNAICAQPPAANLGFTQNKIAPSGKLQKQKLAEYFSEIFIVVFVYKNLVGPIPLMCNVGLVVSQRQLQWDPTVLSQMHTGGKAPF